MAAHISNRNHEEPQKRQQGIIKLWISLILPVVVINIDFHFTMTHDSISRLISDKLAKTNVNGQLFQKSDWESIERIVPSPPPKWYKELSLSCGVSKLRYYFDPSPTTGDELLVCIVYSPSVFANLLKNTYLCHGEFAKRGLGAGWFPLGDAENGDYWILKSDGGINDPVYYYADHSWNSADSLSCDNGLGKMFVSIKDFFSSARIVEITDEEEKDYLR